MGATCCSVECTRDGGLNSDEVSIIPAPSLRGIKDQYRRFEYTLPFYTIEIDSFFQYMNLASMD